MSKVQSHPDFWTFTRTSAQDAVRLYFEPIRVFASWISNHVELWVSRRQDVQARNRGVAAADTAWVPVLLERLEALDEEPVWASALKKGLLEQGRQLKGLTEKVGQILEATKDARHEERQLDLLNGLKSKMEGMEAQMEGTRKAMRSPRPNVRDAGLHKFSLADELRAIRGGSVQGEARPKRPGLPEEIEHRWRSDLDRMERRVEEALQAISDFSGVQLPEAGAKPEGEGVPPLQVDVAALKPPEELLEDLRRGSESRLKEARQDVGPLLGRPSRSGREMSTPLSLAQELRGIRGVGKRSRSDLEDLLSEIRDTRFEWQLQVDQAQNILHDLLLVIAELSGVELPEEREGRGRDSSLQPGFKTLKERIRGELEGFASASAADAMKKVQGEGGLALEPLEKEMSARMDDLAEEIWRRVKSSLDEGRVETANQLKARAEEVLQAMMDDLTEESGRAADRLKELIRQVAERPGKGAEK